MLKNLQKANRAGAKSPPPAAVATTLRDLSADSDVITLRPGQLRPAPLSRSAIETNYLLAVGAVQDRMLILVDIEKADVQPRDGAGRTNLAVSTSAAAGRLCTGRISHIQMELAP